VQIPTPDETNDNIAAYWVPDTPPKPGTAFDIEYRLHWQKEEERRPSSAWVTQTRRGHGWVRKPDDSIALLVDFDGPSLNKLPVDASVKPVVSSNANGKILETNTIRNDAQGGWRMVVKLKRLDDKKPVELRGYLTSANQTLTETWSYILPPE
jgi:glucans biosynthesis protein